MTREEFKQKYSEKWHLGDGLFAHFDGYHIILSTPREDGEHYVGLEPSVFNNLIEWRKELYKDAENLT